MRECLHQLRTRWRRWRLLRAYSRVSSVHTGAPDWFIDYV